MGSGRGQQERRREAIHARQAAEADAAERRATEARHAELRRIARVTLNSTYAPTGQVRASVRYADGTLQTVRLDVGGPDGVPRSNAALRAAAVEKVAGPEARSAYEAATSQKPGKREQAIELMRQALAARDRQRGEGEQSPPATGGAQPRRVARESAARNRAEKEAARALKPKQYEPADAQRRTARLSTQQNVTGSARTVLDDALGHVISGGAGGATRDQERTTLAAYHERVVGENAVVANSYAQRQKLWGAIKSQYLMDRRYPEFRAFLAAYREAGERGAGVHTQHQVMLLMRMRTDRTLRDAMANVVGPSLGGGARIFPKEALRAFYQQLARSSRASWNAATLDKMTSKTIQLLREAGYVRGIKRPVFDASARTGDAAVRFAAQLYKLDGGPNRRILTENPYLLGVGLHGDAAERALIRAQTPYGHPRPFTYQAQGGVIDLGLPPLPEP